MNADQDFVLVPGSADTDPRDDVTVAATILENTGIWKRSPFDAKYPLTDEHVLSLLHANQYLIPIELVEDQIDRKLLASPAVDEDGNREWNAVDLLHLVALLERRQSWLPGSELHDKKKSVTKKHLEQIRMADCCEEYLASMPARPDVSLLLRMLVDSGDTSTREQVADFMKLELQASYDILIP